MAFVLKCDSCGKQQGSPGVMGNPDMTMLPSLPKGWEQYTINMHFIHCCGKDECRVRLSKRIDKATKASGPNKRPMITKKAVKHKEADLGDEDPGFEIVSGDSRYD